MYHLKLELLGLPKTTNSGARRHWRALQQEAKRWQRAVFIAVGQHKPNQPLEKARLTLTRYSSREPDYDGLVSSFKHAIDGLKLSGVILDDKMSVIGQPEYLWKQVAKKKGHVTIEVLELPSSSTQPDSLPLLEPILAQDQNTVLPKLY